MNKLWLIAAICLACNACSQPSDRASFDRGHTIRDEMHVIDGLLQAITPGLEHALSVDAIGRVAAPGHCVKKRLYESGFDHGEEDETTREALRQIGLTPRRAARSLADKPSAPLPEADIARQFLNAVDINACKEDTQIFSFSRVHFYRHFALVGFSVAGCPTNTGYFVLIQLDPRSNRRWTLYRTLARRARCPYATRPPERPADYFLARGYA